MFAATADPRRNRLFADRATATWAAVSASNARRSKAHPVAAAIGNSPPDTQLAGWLDSRLFPF